MNRAHAWQTSELDYTSQINSRLEQFYKDYKSLVPPYYCSGEKFVFGDRCLDLSNRPRMLKLFEICCELESSGLTLSHLLDHVYDLPAVEQKKVSNYSIGYYRNRAVTLVMRARKMMKEHLNLGIVGWQWLPYDQTTETWALYQISIS